MTSSTNRASYSPLRNSQHSNGGNDDDDEEPTDTAPTVLPLSPLNLIIDNVDQDTEKVQNQEEEEEDNEEEEEDLAVAPNAVINNENDDSNENHRTIVNTPSTRSVHFDDSCNEVTADLIKVNNDYEIQEIMDIEDEEHQTLLPRSDKNDINNQDAKSLLELVLTLKKRISKLEVQTTKTENVISDAQNKAQSSDEYDGLDEDVFTLMIVNDVFTSSWFFGIGTFILQMALLSFIFSYQLSEGFGSTPFDVPFTVKLDVRFAQFFAIAVSVMLSKDVVMPIKELSMLWITNDGEWKSVIRQGNYNRIRRSNRRGSRRRSSNISYSHQDPMITDITTQDWYTRILLPNVLKFTEGLFVLVISFVIIIQSDNVIVLFKDFAAMQLIAEIDNVAFFLANHGYFGSNLKNDAVKAKKVRVKDEVPKTCFNLPLRPVVLFFVFFLLLTAFLPIMVLQDSGQFFFRKYRNCEVNKEEIHMAGDDKCDGGRLNTPQCGFDAGDCIEFNLAYPNCEADLPYKVGDNNCDEKYNTINCAWDGGDCCPYAYDLDLKELLNDKKCHAGWFNTKNCNYDESDCNKFRQDFPDCPEEKSHVFGKDGQPVGIGDGVCSYAAAYLLTEECGFEGGDCSKECKPTDLTKLVNNVCDGGEYNTEACDYDAGACETCNDRLKELNLDNSKLGNGFCDGKEYASIEECNRDGNDCEGCDVTDFSLIGDGFCNGGAYMSENCSNDGKDCEGCNVANAFKVGDGFCDGGNYMSESCSNDGGDCEGCDVPDVFKVGDGICDGGKYNTKECSWDGGDCDECNLHFKYDIKSLSSIGDGFCNGGDYMSQKSCDMDGGDCVECNALHPNRIMDGTCDGGDYNTEGCDYDGGDCEEFNRNYPDCLVSEPSKIGNGKCDNLGFEYNTKLCYFDGGDCDFNNKNLIDRYPNCTLVSPVEVGWIGNGYCNSELNNEDCGFDDGDCDEFNEKYPNCTASDPWILFNSKCDALLPYNTEACGWDGGACEAKNMEMREKYPMCEAKKPDAFGLLANDRCDYQLNIAECGFDDEHCKKFLEKFPHCILNLFTIEPWKIGDGHCDFVQGGKWNPNQKVCGYDGGDCDEYNKMMRNTYPNCSASDEFMIFVNDTICHSKTNTEECGYDGGDCIKFNEVYPGCKAYRPYRVGDGECNVKTDPAINSTECKYDGGDCI